MGWSHIVFVVLKIKDANIRRVNRMVFNKFVRSSTTMKLRVGNKPDSGIYGIYVMDLLIWYSWTCLIHETEITQKECIWQTHCGPGNGLLSDGPSHYLNQCSVASAWKQDSPGSMAFAWEQGSPGSMAFAWKQGSSGSMAFEWEQFHSECQS